MAFHYSPKIITDGLMLCLDAANSRSYPGSGLSWTDISRNEYDAALTGTSYLADNNGSLVFDGVNSYGTLPNIAIGPSGTINVWFKQSSATNNKGLFGLAGATNSTHFYIGGTSDTQLSIYNGVSYSSGLVIPANRKTSWNMATYVWSNDTATLYLNGGSPLTTSSYSFGTSGTAYVGIYPTLYAPSRFNGNISNVMAYSKALTAEQVAANYRALKTRYE